MFEQQPQHNIIIFYEAILMTERYEKKERERNKEKKREKNRKMKF